MSQFWSTVRWVFAAAIIALFISLGVVTGRPPVVPGLIAAVCVTAVMWAVRRRLPPRVRPTHPLQLLGVFWVVLFVGALAYDYTVNLPPTESEGDRVAADLERIPQPSSAVRMSLGRSIKPGSALVDAMYKGAIGWPELRSHFDRVLGADGWTLEGDQPLLEWGADNGGRTACYRKGNDVAHVDIPSRGSSYTYSFSIWWHPRPAAC